MKKILVLICGFCLLSGTSRGQTTKPLDASAAPVAVAKLAMYPQFMAGDFFARNWMKTVPHMIQLSETAPDGIKKQPAYKGKPLYGSIRLGDDPSAPETFLVMDDDGNRVFIDSHQNGDLTLDPAIHWEKATKTDDKVSFEGTFTLPANWKSGTGKYGIKMYRPNGSLKAFWQTISAPTGVITLGGKPYIAFLYDPNGHGIYDTMYSKENKTMATEVFVDIDGDGTWRPAGHSEDVSLGMPIKVDDQWYSFSCSADGTTLTATVTDAPPESKIPVVAFKKAGDKAPDFEMSMPDGSKVHLSDFKGKTVVVDFWATWCGPCQRALPEVEKLWKSVRSDDNKVVFLGLCVSDERPSFDKWITTRGPEFTFKIGYDPAGNTDPAKGACHNWGVDGIPSTFVIDPNGVVVQSISGFSPDNESLIVAALDKLGIKPHG